MRKNCFVPLTGMVLVNKPFAPKKPFVTTTQLLLVPATLLLQTTLYRWLADPEPFRFVPMMVTYPDFTLTLVMRGVPAELETLFVATTVPVAKPACPQALVTHNFTV
jgi:hypothetical protein